MDLSLYHAVNDFAYRHDRFEDLLRFFATDGEVLFVALLAFLWLPLGRWALANGRRAVAAAGFSALLALGMGHVIAEVVDRARPYAHHRHHLFIHPSADPSFPSDHATASFAIAVAIWLRHRTAGWIALALAALVSGGRVVVGTHYPSDVVGGALLGTLVALLLWLPPIRRPLHALADWVGDLYARLASGALRQRPGAVGRATAGA